MQRRENIAKNLDWTTLFLYLMLVGFGWATIYAVGFKDGAKVFDFSTQHGKQMIWIGASMVLALVILIVDSKFYSTIAFPVYFATILLLVAAFFLAPEVKGSRSWFDIGPARFQPSEFAKFATALALARYLTSLNVSLKTLRGKLDSLAIIGVPTLLIILQGDTGSAIVFLGFFVVLYREGFPVVVPLILFYILALFILGILLGKTVMMIGLLIIFLGIIGLLSVNFKINKAKIFFFSIILALSLGFSAFVVNPVFNNVLKEHHRNRINVLLGKEFGKGADYNVLQSKIAIGSGGFSGKGYLEGTLTKGDFVPEQSTDFIFSTIGEEHGFVGTTLFISLYIFFMIRITIIAERQRSKFTQVYAYGVLSIFLFHFVINIGMTIGVLPVVGIPLPFISYGGSSLWGFTILLFILLKLDSNRMLVFR